MWILSLHREGNEKRGLPVDHEIHDHACSVETGLAQHERFPAIVAPQREIRRSSSVGSLTSADVAGDTRRVSCRGVFETERSGILRIPGHSGLRFDPV